MVFDHWGVQRWIWLTSQWDLLIFGGKEDAGSGKFAPFSIACTNISNVDDRDVAAGIAILQEAGGLVTTANPPEDCETGHIEEVRLGSRLYLAIRPAGASATETGRESQERTVREVWKRVRHLEYSRPGA